MSGSGILQLISFSGPNYKPDGWVAAQSIFFSHRFQRETFAGTPSIRRPESPETLFDEARSSSTSTAINWLLRMCGITPRRAMIVCWFHSPSFPATVAYAGE